MAEPNYGGARINKVTQEEIDKVYEDEAMKPSAHHPPPGNHVPSIADVIKEARKDAEEEEEPRCGGARQIPNVMDMDMRPYVDKQCAVNCHHAWEEYEKCEKRIEAKGAGDCASWYMDYLKRRAGTKSRHRHP